MRKIATAPLGALLLILAFGAMPVFAGPFGPTPYLSFADSPFAVLSFSYFYLEDFEDGLLNVPGVILGGSQPSDILGPAFYTDSVDADDGLIDGSGKGGHSLWVHSGNQPTIITFTLGNLPTHVGLVWTDGYTNVNVQLQAFGPGNVLLGTVGPAVLGDSSSFGETAEDRFFGWSDLGGIQSIVLTDSGAGTEVDHLQFGQLQSVPEPATILLLGFGLFGLTRYGRRKFFGE